MAGPEKYETQISQEPRGISEFGREKVHTISSRSRYDLFDTAPYEIVGMQTTGKRIGYKVGITE